MLVVLIICFITTLPLCYASWRMVRKEYKESSLFLLIGTIFYSFIFLYGMWVRISHGGSDVATMRQMYALVGQTDAGLQQLQYMMRIATCGLALLNIAFAIIICRTKHPITYSSVFAMVIIGLLCMLGTVFFGGSFASNFFVACCGIMAYFAYILELTYKESCVLGNIYLQASICLVAAVAPVLVCLRKWSDSNSFLKLAVSVINLSIHGILFLMICKHYWIPLESAFNLCYRELVHLASVTGSTYIIVNLVIFVILFVGDLILNSVLYRIMK